MAILDADKEGYLRSKTSLIQTIGRAARNIDSKVIMYADKKTKSMKEAIEETERRRTKQLEYNRFNNITPLSIKKSIDEILESTAEQDHVTVEIKNAKQLVGKDLDTHIKKLEKKMNGFASKLEFEDAAQLRDQINRLRAKQMGLSKKALENRK
jgi:excinuclease ABC subunit B